MSWPAYFEGTKFKIRLFLSFIQPPNRMMHFFLLGKDCSLPKSYFLVRDAHLLYGSKYEDGEWKSRTNRELEEPSKGENIVKWIKGQRISWLGHLERMEEDRMPKKIFTQELEWTRRRGRPRKGWREEVERDLQVVRVRRWRELVIGKNGEVLFDRPKPTAGCSVNGRRRRRN